MRKCMVTFLICILEDYAVEIWYLLTLLSGLEILRIWLLDLI
jgi:hypothetical protein